MIIKTIPALKALSPDEKMVLAAELWREAVATKADDPDPKFIEALRERLEFYQQEPDEVSSWESVRARILEMRRR